MANVDPAQSSIVDPTLQAELNQILTELHYLTLYSQALERRLSDWRERSGQPGLVLFPRRIPTARNCGSPPGPARKVPAS